MRDIGVYIVWVTCILKKGEARGKGGGGSGGAGWRGAIPGAVYANQARTNFDKNDWSSVETFPTWAYGLIGVITVFALALLVWLFYKVKEQIRETSRSCNEKSGEENQLTCYLCKCRVKVSQWKNGEHRRKCGADNRDFLEGLPTPGSLNIRCPKCRKRLKIWPANHGPPFACCSSKCPIVGRIRSNGQNRFTCFPCAFDFCESCVNRKLGRVSWTEEPERRRQSPPVDERRRQSPPVETTRCAPCTGQCRSSWYSVPHAGDANPSAPAYSMPSRSSVAAIGETNPSAPVFDIVDDSEPPPSYREAVYSQKPLKVSCFY